MLMKEVYGEAAYNSSKQPSWEHLVERCSFPKMPEQGVHKRAFYMLKAAYLYDGIKLIEEVKKHDVFFADLFNYVFISVLPFHFCQLSHAFSWWGGQHLT